MIKWRGKNHHSPFSTILLLLTLIISCSGEDPQRKAGTDDSQTKLLEIEFADKFSRFIADAVENIPSGFSPQSIFNNIFQIGGGGMGMGSSIGSAPRMKLKKEKFLEDREPCSEGGELITEVYPGKDGRIVSEFKADNCREKDVMCGGYMLMSGGITSYTSFCKDNTSEIKDSLTEISDYNMCFEGGIKGRITASYAMEDRITSAITEWFADKLTSVILISGLYKGGIFMFFREGDKFVFSTPKFYIGIFPEEATTYINYKIKSFTPVKGEEGRGVVVASEIESYIHINGIVSLKFGTEKSTECSYVEGVEVRTEEPLSVYIKSSEIYGDDVQFEVSSGKIRIGEYLSVEIKGDTIRIYVDGELRREVKLSSQKCLEGEAFLCEEISM